MSQILPIGRSAAAVVNFDNGTRIYYQHHDGAIHELSGTGTIFSKAKYTDKVIITADQARSDTPIASAVSDNEQLKQVSFPYLQRRRAI
jgi:hypothetical protein